MPQPKQKTAPAATSNGAAGRRVIDLDQARAARAETAKEPVTLRIGGEDFELAPEMPVAFALYASEGQMLKAVEAILGEHFDAFLKLRPSVADLEALADQAGQVYGITPGEAPASQGS